MALNYVDGTLIGGYEEWCYYKDMLERGRKTRADKFGQSVFFKCPVTGKLLSIRKAHIHEKILYSHTGYTIKMATLTLDKHTNK